MSYSPFCEIRMENILSSLIFGNSMVWHSLLKSDMVLFNIKYPSDNLEKFSFTIFALDSLKEAPSFFFVSNSSFIYLNTSSTVEFMMSLGSLYDSSLVM